MPFSAKALTRRNVVSCARAVAGTSAAESTAHNESRRTITFMEAALAQCVGGDVKEVADLQ